VNRGGAPLKTSPTLSREPGPSQVITMAKVTVYFFTMYDIHIDDKVKSKSMTTLDNIKRYCGTPLMETALEIEENKLDAREHYKP
jgi:hypothetical protein